MKILYSCLSKSWGGLEMFTLTSIQQLIKRDIKVELICSAESRIHIEANNMGIMLHPVNASGYFHPVTALRLAILLRQNDYSMVHTQASKDLWVIVPALYLANRKIPLFLTKQVGSFIVKKDFLHNLLYKRIRKIFAISTVIKDNLLETTPIKPEDVIIVPNGTDPNRFDPDTVDDVKVRKEFNITNEEIVIGMLARFTPGKGHEEFLLAAKELNKEYSNLRFLVVGEPSRGETEYADKIKLLAREYELNNLVFTGFRGDIPEILAAMDIFAFPSHSEAFGIALVEAMAMKKPSVCSNAEGVLDIAVDGETSYLFENKNATDLKAKLKSLIEFKEKRVEFGENARKRAIENFDIEIVTDKVLKIYHEEMNIAY
ncbi:MAG: glycosyltransferase family 4 protein [Ignavibacteriaceae bacterium]|nr:glycosyltransferase family 4 protein [Ignavibacteriaceae bacterium]